LKWFENRKMAGVPGIEPGMTGSKPVALPLGYTPTTEKIRGGNGAANRIRTRGLMITNQLLYQLSYCGIPECFDLIITLLEVRGKSKTLILQRPQYIDLIITNQHIYCDVHV
jgi:hypothetical protein